MKDFFAPTLLQWFDRHGRDLPWRHRPDTYAIWLSEVILQQTRVQQGMEYWYRFLDRFPTVETLAAASEDEVLRQWQGLGYYARARHLHQAAKQVVALGAFPDTYEGLLRLSGVGPYTAAAVASFAFGQRVAPVDGNVYRVLARFFAIDTPINSTEGKKLFACLAEELLPEQRVADYNQAMMDFGATQCTPTSPDCTSCPLADRCGARAEDKVELLPEKIRKLKVKERRMDYLVIISKGCVAIRRREENDIWRGLWEPVNLTDAAEELKASLRQHEPEWILLLQNVMHVLTHRRIVADFHIWTPQQRPDLPPDYQWVDYDDLENYGFPVLVLNAFDYILRIREE